VWRTEHNVETDADPGAIWGIWSDVTRWPEWNADLERAEISGPFGVGSTVTMFPHQGEPIELQIAEAVEPEMFVDEARLGAVVVRTIHRIDRLESRRIRIVYAVEIRGHEVDMVGPQLGPEISADFPQVLASLVERAQTPMIHSSGLDEQKSAAPANETKMMSAVRLVSARALDGLVLEQAPIPRPGPGEALVRVHAAAITRDELDWPVDRLPAIPSYELSGVVAGLGSNVFDVHIGDPVWALTGFDRDGAAAEYTLVPASFLAPKPHTLGHLASAAIPLPGLTAWQGLFDYGHLQPGERLLIHGAAGGVGRFGVQLALWRGAYVIGTGSSAAAVDQIRALGADEAVDRSRVQFEEAVAPVDLVLDTVGGEALARSPAILRDGGRLVSVAEEPPAVSEKIQARYFVVEPSREQLVELARLVEEGTIRPVIDSSFPLAKARAAFERVMMPGKRGKVVLQVVDDWKNSSGALTTAR
jgi:NADPH:quinone reductase-like Zn-dependent oxidoreductase